MQPEKIQELVNKYLNGTATPEEQQTLTNWYRDGQNDPVGWVADEENEEERLRLEMLGEIRRRTGLKSEKPPKRLWMRIAAAASVILALSAAGYFALHPKNPAAVQFAQHKHDIAPGGNKAILTLSNGQQIVLNGKTGQIASQAGKQILINAHGQIAYVGTGNSNEPVYNTLTVPIGNSRDLTLPDGSEVSLDAGSSITYPVVFKSERRVSMTGQAYFKVKHDTRHPFYTIVKGITIKDIGTEFNINAYDDEPAIQTTLVQGSVTVNKILLKPGQQAQVKNNNIDVKRADIDAVTAWKDNDFYFDNQNLKSSMRQIARWYNVKVVYNNVDEKLQLFVDVTRATNLTVVLKAIENTGKVRCSLEGNTIILSQPN